MAILGRTALKTVFETGDKPTGSNFVDLIDSAVNLADVTAQSFASNIRTPGIAVTTLSAGSVFINEFITSATISSQNLDVSTISAATVSAQSIRVTTVNSNIVSAQRVRSSAVYYKSPHIHTLTSGNTATVQASSIAVISAVNLTAISMVGFTHNGAGIITYTGSTTANMLIEYTLGIAVQNTTAQHVATVLMFKNSANEVSGIRCRNNITGTINDMATFAGQGITQMKTNDFVQLSLASNQINFPIVIGNYFIDIVPVSWEF